jgi:GDSL-like Lipase/Acylhydrolase family
MVGHLARRMIRRSAEAAAVLIISFMLLEVIGRLGDPLGISYYPETARFFDTMVIEEPIGYRNQPNLMGQFWGAPVTINSLGLRDREVNLEPADNEFRILLLGDSRVFGLGLADQDTYSNQLEQQLNRDADGITYRVINMGVPSYNTEQELIQLQSLGLSLNPDLVLLIFSLNDLQPKMWVLERRKSVLANIAQRSYAASLLAVFYWELRFRLTGQDERASFRRNFEKHPGWSNVEAAMAEISALCRKNGIPFVLFLGAQNVGGEPRGPYPRLQSLADRAGFPMVDLEALRAADSRWEGLKLSISATNNHSNQLGAEVNSTLMRESLQRLGIIRGSDRSGAGRHGPAERTGPA